MDHTNTIMPAEIMYDTTQKVPQHPFAEQYVKTISPDHLWAKPGIMPLNRLWPLPGFFVASSLETFLKPCFPFSRVLYHRLAGAASFEALHSQHGFLHLRKTPEPLGCSTRHPCNLLLRVTLFQGRMGNPLSMPSLWGHGWGGIRFARLQSSMISTPT